MSVIGCIWVALNIPVSSAILLHATDCPEFKLAYLGSTITYTKSGLLASALQHGKDYTMLYKVVDHNIVCLSQGSVKDRYSTVSIFVNYMIQGQRDTSRDQFHFQCINDEWSIRVFANPKLSRSNSSIKANLLTPLRQDCWACVDLNHPGLLTRSEDEHCLACPKDCTGLNRCLLNRTCCNYFDLNGKCALQCPEYSSPDETFHCRCDTGFMNKNGNCVLIDDCVLNPCRNGGNCVHGEKLTTCVCPEGFGGSICELCIDKTCKECYSVNNKTLCTECRDGYLKSKKMCVSCEVANCKICSEVGVCSECMKSFSLDSGSCFEISAQEVESKTGRNPEAIFYPILGGALVIILGTVVQYTCQTKT